MINLIPNEEKKRMTVDFYSRLLVLFLLMISLSLFVACVAILSAYIYSSVQVSSVNKKLQIQKEEPLPVPGEQSLATVKDVNNKLDIVEKAEKNKFLITDKVINAIIAEKTSDIKITQIQYQDDPIQGKKISILGIASSRETLLTFEDALKNDPVFKNVDLPISNFVKISNIQFDLSLMPS